MKMLRSHAGDLVVAITPLHFLAGLLFYADPLADMVRAGLFNSVGTHADRDAAVWFMVSGVLILLLGLLIRWTQAQTGTLPASIGWGFVAFGAVGCVLVPLSGFPLLVLLGGLLVAAAKPVTPPLSAK